MTVRLFEILNTGWLTLMLRGKNLKDIEYFSKSDPFYEVRTKIGDEWYIFTYFLLCLLRNILKLLCSSQFV